jgi:hypothetical protein
MPYYFGEYVLAAPWNAAQDFARPFGDASASGNWAKLDTKRSVYGGVQLLMVAAGSKLPGPSASTALGRVGQSAAAGAVFGSAFDVNQQAYEIGTGKRNELDLEQNATSAAAGAALFGGLHFAAEAPAVLNEGATSLRTVEQYLKANYSVETEGLGMGGGNIRVRFDPKAAGVGSEASSALKGTQLKEYLRQSQEYGAGGVRALENSRFRFYGEISPASKPGEMVGRRMVREWDPATGAKRTWHETLDQQGRIRQVRPDVSATGGEKVHYTFDAEGNFTGSW